MATTTNEGAHMSAEPPVGVIGIGLMGEVFARRLVSAGFSVVGFDIDPGV
jgi:3-hydroxyisobutyrate dehydrogenase-like beta-hydroxyacid dehydrogenase